MALYDDMSGDQRDAATALVELFKQNGLETLAPKIIDYIKQGFSSATISLMLADTPEYKQRFIGNEARKKAGYSVLSPGEYIAVENSYRQIMQSAGLPSGFYDDPSDFAEFIGANKSPAEINDRVQAAVQFTQSRDPQIKQAAQRYLGVSEGQLAAFFLDPDRAMPDIERTIKSVGIGAEAARAGFAEFDKITAERLADEGVDQNQARQGFSAISQTLPTLNKLSEIYRGNNYGIDQAVAETFEGSGDAANKRKKLASQERGSFSGSGGQGKTSLTKSTNYSY